MNPIQEADTSESENTSDVAEEWKDIAERMQMEMEAFVSERYGNTSGTFLQNLHEATREKYDYTEFLRKFAVRAEVMRINDDEFDYIFYTYGLSLYDNMPLIEPLEYKEDKLIREFVVAIDTSGSVSGDLVQKFVQKTYKISSYLLDFAIPTRDLIKQEAFEQSLRRVGQRRSWRVARVIIAC